MDKYDIALVKVAASELGGFKYLVLEAVREKQARENPQSLTLEQLKERGEAPVWLAYGKLLGWRQLAYCQSEHDRLAFWDFGDEVEDTIPLSEYGKTAFAYLYPPKEAAQ